MCVCVCVLFVSGKATDNLRHSGRVSWYGTHVRSFSFQHFMTIYTRYSIMSKYENTHGKFHKYEAQPSRDIERRRAEE